MSVQAFRDDSHRFGLTVGATGEVKNRDAWQATFELWCDSHCLHPVFIRGNIRTERTQARVVVVGAAPILDSFAQLSGIESFFFAGGSEARISQLETQVLMLRKQNVELARMMERVHSSSSARGGR